SSVCCFTSSRSWLEQSPAPRACFHHSRVFLRTRRGRASGSFEASVARVRSSWRASDGITDTRCAQLCAELKPSAWRSLLALGAAFGADDVRDEPAFTTRKGRGHGHWLPNRWESSQRQ